MNKGQDGRGGHLARQFGLDVSKDDDGDGRGDSGGDGDLDRGVHGVF